ncbi:2-polyprenylphenol hydroxylase [Corynebacterium callunae]|uniref:2-polyprenylphenol hydroxylase n=1 Tax=Corynebacterium callunae TaxID=1721 RepID=UPI003981C90F
MTPRPLKAVVDLIEDNAPTFLDAIAQRLLILEPSARGHFPSPDDHTHVSLAELLTSVLDGTGAEGKVEPDTLAYFEKLAVDYRRFGVTPKSLLALGEAIRIELRILCADLPFETVLFAERAVSATALAMSASAQAAEDAGVLPYISAQVVQVEKRSRRFFVVRLQAEGELPYKTGQYVPVSTSYLPNTWRYLCPAIPANEWGQVEFHIQSDVDDISRLLANSQVGDSWIIGPGQGDFGQSKMNQPNDLLFISHGTGLAPLRAYMFELLNQAVPPRLHFFVGAEYPGELYELMGMWNFAAASPWLSVVPVIAHDEDEWWVQATDASKPPRGLHLPQVGSMAKVVTNVGAWADRNVLVAGPEQWARDIKRAMIRRGTPADQIEILGF